MNKALIFGLLLVLAVIGLGFGFVNYQERQDLASREAEQAERLRVLESSAAELEAQTQAAETARRQAATRAAQAEEARRMAEEQAALAEEERQQRIAELNEQLRLAAQSRQEAQEQAERLNQRINELAAAREEAAQRLAALEASRQADGGESSAPQESDLSQLLAQQEGELARLRQENEELNQRTQVLLDRQIEAEEAIVAQGGDIRLPLNEIMSPSSRRYQAQRHRVRSGGSPQEAGPAESSVDPAF